MGTVKRLAVIVHPGAPFVAWAARVQGVAEAQLRAEMEAREPNAYLLPGTQVADMVDPEVLSGHWDRIFKEELREWSQKEREWPSERSEALFRAWFQISFSTLPYDLGRVPLKLER